MFKRRSAQFSKLPILMLGAALALGCCFSAAAEDAKPAEDTKPAEASKAPKVYRLEPGDEIAITVVPQKGFDSKGVILPDGTLRLAGIGKIVAGGMSLDELEDFVRKALSKELKDPDVTATLEKMHEPPKPVEKPVEKLGFVTIVGAVVKSGPLELQKGLRVKKAIDLAGGPTKEADLSSVLIVHRDLTKTVVNLATVAQITDPAHNLELKEGDSVNIPLLPDKEELPHAVIRGAVTKQGDFEVKEGMTIEGLVGMAGGFAQLADPHKIQIRRMGRAEVETIDLEERYKQGILGKVNIQPGDEIFVPEVKDTVSVIGAIQKGGQFSINPGQTTIVELLSSGRAELTGATNGLLVDLNNVELVRSGEAKPRKIRLREAIGNPSGKENVALANGDIIYLPGKTQKKSLLDRVSQFSSVAFMFAAF